ncbi:MAG: gliding motility-associated C-terminal domain-containing protein [Bacteroidota bacterium]
MKFLILSIFVLTTIFFKTYSQTVNITDADLNPLPCASFGDELISNFVDDGAAGNYGPNRRDTITVCPDLPNGPKINLRFGVIAPFEFNIDPTDTLYIFNGPNVDSALLLVTNSAIHPAGFEVNSNFINNPTGCITMVFHSDATNEGTGWEGNITCVSPPQPIIPHIEAYINGQGVNVLNPLDTGYVDICLGDSILFIAKPDFPNALENTGTGYSQNLDNITFEWETSNGWQGPANDSIYFKPLIRSGFYLDLKMRDIRLELTQTFCKIRVSQLPLFFTAGPVQNPICAHTQGILLGGASATDTVGLEFPPGAFVLGGTVSGLKYLPDGDGQVYTTTITMEDFPAGSVFNSISDLQSICLDMEHSYIEDIEVWLKCPNGQEVGLINAYSGIGDGHLPGGFGGGGTYLGDPDDNQDSIPGLGWNYCFSSVNATFGTMGDEFNAGNTLTSTINPIGPSMNPNGVYLPETSFTGFIGCPLNGDWTISVQDNQPTDDGFIFEWALTFNSILFPDVETYANHLVDFNWHNDPTIIATQGDTAIVVFPDLPGSYNYTFEVTDDYGCLYDTIVNLVVKDTVKIVVLDVAQCDTIVNQVNNVGIGGAWSNLNLQDAVIFADINDVNTTITFPESGVFDLVYTDLLCDFDDTIHVTIHPTPEFNLNSTYLDCPNGVEITSLGSNLQDVNMNLTVWDPSKPQFSGQNNVQLPFGTYNATIISPFGCERDTIFTIEQQVKINIATYSHICDLGLNMNLNPIINPAPTGVDINGNWAKISGPGTVTFTDATDFQTTFTVSEYGSYLLRYSEGVCGDYDSIVVNFFDDPTITVFDAQACKGQPFEIVAQANVPAPSITWSTGETGSSIFATEKDYYYATATNLCGSVKDSALIDLRLCEMVFPNIFTPNSDDAINNSFHLVVPTDAYAEFTCQIFNRWGNLVYEYFSTTGAWDGKTGNGELVSPGTYMYKVTAKTFVGDHQETHGYIQVIE